MISMEKALWLDRRMCALTSWADAAFLPLEQRFAVVLADELARRTRAGRPRRRAAGMTKPGPRGSALRARNRAGERCTGGPNDPTGNWRRHGGRSHMGWPRSNGWAIWRQTVRAKRRTTAATVMLIGCGWHNHRLDQKAAVAKN